jgi:hypothetical protein
VIYNRLKLPEIDKNWIESISNGNKDVVEDLNRLIGILHAVFIQFIMIQMLNDFDRKISNKLSLDVKKVVSFYPVPVNKPFFNIDMKFQNDTLKGSGIQSNKTELPKSFNNESCITVGTPLPYEIRIKLSKQWKITTDFKIHVDLFSDVDFWAIAGIKKWSFHANVWLSELLYNN